MVEVMAQLAFAIILVGLAGLAVVALGVGRLEGPTGILRDGLPHGALAPVWSHVDSKGAFHFCPRRTGWQVILFGEHSLASFPSAVKAFARLDEDTSLECLVATRGDPQLVRTVFRSVANREVVVIKVSKSFYDAHRVRVLPFMFAIDDLGRVRAMGLANSDDQVFRIWRHARLVEISSHSHADVLV